VDLLANGKLTEQVMQSSGPGTELLPLSIKRVRRAVAVSRCRQPMRQLAGSAFPALGFAFACAVSDRYACARALACCAFVARQPMGVIFAERKSLKNTVTFVEELVPGRYVAAVQRKRHRRA
jgi:hypothetical protein